MTKQSSESLDLALIGFAQKLRALGLSVDQHRIQTAYRCFAAFNEVGHGDNLYWAGRISFCSRKEDFAIYDLAFDRWFNGTTGIRQVLTDPQSERVAAVRGEPLTSNEDEISNSEEKKVATASEVEILRNADMALLSLNARAQVEDWIGRLRPIGRTRLTRRFDQGRGTNLDRRRTVKAALRAGGEVAEIIFRDRRRVPRRILFLIDVSGSMKSYSNAYLRFAYATKRARSSTEVFTIGTRLTRITRSLTQASAERGINQALLDIPDWSGGTRLGGQLREFIRDYGARGAARGAIVVIASDGWERGDVTALGLAVTQLSRLAHRIIWVNPHLHRPGFAPLTAGMKIVLPHVDQLLSGHSYKSFEDLCNEISDRR
jgi:uncharacterized protein with von Willebrand factor type A (vWA) domain